jgi:hypothetical protein
VPGRLVRTSKTLEQGVRARRRGLLRSRAYRFRMPRPPSVAPGHSAISRWSHSVIGTPATCAKPKKPTTPPANPSCGMGRTFRCGGRGSPTPGAVIRLSAAKTMHDTRSLTTCRTASRLCSGPIFSSNSLMNYRHRPRPEESADPQFDPQANSGQCLQTPAKEVEHRAKAIRLGWREASSAASDTRNGRPCPFGR